MRRWIATLALLLAPLPVRADQPPAEAPLTLAQALARALSTSPRLEAARAGVSAARAREREARAAGQPSLEADIRGRAQGPAVSIDIPAPPGGAGPQLPGGGTLNPSRVLEAELRALYPLYTGGRVSAGKRAARRGELAARARVEAEAQLLVLDVTEAYLDALEALQQTQLAGAERELSEERLRIARVRQAAGAAIPLEVSQAEADLARAVQREIEAHARLRQAGATLNTLIRRPATAPLVLAALPEAEPRHPLLMPQTAPLTPDRVLALGLERPDLRALREEVRQAEAQVDAARAARRPLVSLSGSLLKRVPATLLGGFAWSLGASLVQSLFDGGQSRSRVEAARAERVRRAATLAEAERQAEEQVEQARAALEAAENRLAAEDRRVAVAAEALEVVRTRLRAGVAVPAEAVEAETTLARAQTDAVSARFAAARARVRLAFVAGVAYPESVPDLAVAPPGR